METKHTPGPWKAHPIEMNCGTPYTPVAAKTLLAKVYSEAYGNHAESEANARLIAAAPELLEAAIELKDVCNRPSAARTRAEAWRKLDKAIAKALQPNAAISADTHHQ